MKIERVESEVVEVANVVKKYCCNSMKRICDFGTFWITSKGKLNMAISSGRFESVDMQIKHCPFCGEKVETIT